VHGVTAGGLEPLGLGLLGRDAGELAGRGPAEGAGAQGLAELRQLAQRLGHAQSVFDGPGAAVKEAARVLGEGAVAEVAVDTEVAGEEQPGADVVVEGRLVGGEPVEVRVDGFPVYGLVVRRRGFLLSCFFRLAFRSDNLAWCYLDGIPLKILFYPPRRGWDVTPTLRFDWASRRSSSPEGMGRTMAVGGARPSKAARPPPLTSNATSHAAGAPRPPDGAQAWGGGRCDSIR